MQETPPVILRRNITKVIEITVCTCFILLLVISAMQPKLVQKTAVKEINRKATLTAGVSKQFSEVLTEKTAKNTSNTAGISRHLEEVLKKKQKEAKQAKVEKLQVDTVTSVAKTTETADVEDAKPEILYKSLEEVKISRSMDLTETTGLSREDFCELLANFKYDYAGFYERNAGLIWDLSQKYQVNEIFICGVFALESLYGSNEKHIANHNYGSIMTSKVITVKDENGEEKKVTIQELKPYLTDAEGIEANFKLFANCYLTPEGKYYKGVTLDAIGNTYCPPIKDCPSWAGQVFSCMKKFL